MASLKKQIKNRLPLVGIFLLLLLGVGLFSYPIISNWYGEYTADTTIRHYDEAVQRIGDDALSQMRKAAEEYNKALAGGNSRKVSAADYDSLLAVSDSIAYIEIPKIRVNLPIYHGLSDEVLQRGVGHMEGSSLPVGGTSTHCVLAGHTGLPSAKLFTDLDQLASGDYFYIHALDKVLAYRVDQVLTVLPWEDQYTQIVSGQDYVTLVTCTPYGVNSHRLLVRGTRVPDRTEKKEEQPIWPVMHRDETEQKVPLRTIIWYAGLAVVSSVTVVILLILFVPVFHRKKKRSGESEEDKTNSA